MQGPRQSKAPYASPWALRTLLFVGHGLQGGCKEHWANSHAAPTELELVLVTGGYKHLAPSGAKHAFWN